MNEFGAIMLEVGLKEGQKAAANIGAKFATAAGASLITGTINNNIDKADILKIKSAGKNEDMVKKIKMENIMKKAGVSGLFAAVSVAAFRGLSNVIENSNFDL